MTENEVKNKLEVLKEWVGDASLTRKDMQSVIDEAIQALEEIQQYRAIGTVEEFKAIYNKAIDEFAKSLKTDYVNFDLYYILENNNVAFEITSLKSYRDMIDELAEQLKGGVNG